MTKIGGIRRLALITVVALPAILLPLSINQTLTLAAQPEVSGSPPGGDSRGLAFLGAAVAVLGSTIGAGIALYGVGVGGSALLAERPDQFTAVLILGGLSEGVAIYGLLIGIMILGKI